MRKFPWRAFVVGLVLALAAGYALRSPERVSAPGDAALAPDAAPLPAASPAGATPAPAPSAAAADGTAPGETIAPQPSAGAPLAPFGTLELSRASFPSSGPVVVRLDLVDPSADDEPRPVRMFSTTDQRGILADARLDESRSVATLALPAEFLQPGR